MLNLRREFIANFLKVLARIIPLIAAQLVLIWLLSLLPAWIAWGVVIGMLAVLFSAIIAATMTY